MSASTTPVLPTDPAARKAWSYYVGRQASERQYFSRMMGAEGSGAVIVKRTELKKGQGDEITTLITAKLQGAPRVGSERLEGTEKRLTQFDTKIKIGLIREGVNVGSIMDEQRTGQDLGKIGREVLADWLSEYLEQHIHCHMAGAVGIGQCMTNVLGDDGNFKKIEMPLIPYDAKHLVIGPKGDKTKATLLATELLTQYTLNSVARNTMNKMFGGRNGAAKIEKASVGGRKAFVAALPPEVMADLRNDVGENGWVSWQQSLVRKMGTQAGPFVEGGGMLDNMIIDESPCGTYFGDYGSGGNVKAARTMVMGSGAAAFAQGRQGLRDNLSVELSEDDNDRGHERVIHMKAIFDCIRVQYNEMTHGMIALDTAFTPAPNNQI
jgi:N4-gp56 family major capsid protein